MCRRSRAAIRGRGRRGSIALKARTRRSSSSPFQVLEGGGFERLALLQIADLEQHPIVTNPP